VLRDYLEWPGIQQVFQIHRVRQLPGKTEEETVYGITSLSPAAAGPERLLELSRGLWSIENRLHGVRDVTLGEDACRVRSGSAPQALAALRNVCAHLLEGVQAASKAAALRRTPARSARPPLQAGELNGPARNATSP
jgi:predicted transposase YbfD/YdcC